MPHTVFSPHAESDLQEILDYIAVDDQTAGLSLVAQIREKCEMLAQFPHTGRLRSVFKDKSIRTFSVGNYLILYRPSNDGIEVARVVHGARNYESLL